MIAGDVLCVLFEIRNNTKDAALSLRRCGGWRGLHGLRPVAST